MGFAARGNHVRRQRTVEVAGQSVVIRSVNRTWRGNAAGFYVYLNGERFFVNLLDRTAAEECALTQWRKRHG